MGKQRIKLGEFQFKIEKKTIKKSLTRPKNSKTLGAPKNREDDRSATLSRNELCVQLNRFNLILINPKQGFDLVRARSRKSCP